ncbi:MAG: hypothetical protein ACO1RT_19520 [Planctomycetaceae bacterium]
MHERTRRAVARLLFVLVCAMPTVITLLTVLMTFTPWFANYRRERLQAALSQRIGLTVEIESVEHPAPGTLRLNGVTLREPETKSEVAKVRIVTWVGTDVKVALRLSQPEVQSSMLPFAWRVIHERFLCQPELTRLPVRMAADDLTLHSRTGPLTLRDVDAWLRPIEDGAEATIQWRPAGLADAAPVSISVVRDRSSKTPATDWTMNTGDVPLVCSALADYLPAMRSLGPDATFMGTMRWQLSDAGWMIDLGGSHFDHVDLGTVMQGMAHRLSGRASIELRTCRIEPGQDLDITGTLVAGAGFVSQSLLGELRSQLDFEVAPGSEGDTRDWPYDVLAVRFDLIGADMTLEGICHKQRGQERLPAGMVFAAGSFSFAAASAVSTSSKSLR